MIDQSTIGFLKKLSKNNNKPWFDANRDAYQQARSNFESFIQKVIDAFGKQDASIAMLTAKECMFRINRDVRFSKDKAPYKRNLAASINRAGKKSIYAGYYFHMEPGNSFVGGGIWMPMPAETQKIRQEIDYCWPEFKKIVGSARFSKTFEDLDRAPEFTLSKVPKGYEKENPAAEYLKLKSWVAMQQFTDQDICSDDIVSKTVKVFATIQPLINFLNRSLNDTE